MRNPVHVLFALHLLLHFCSRSALEIRHRKGLSYLSFCSDTSCIIVLLQVRFSLRCHGASYFPAPIMSITSCDTHLPFIVYFPQKYCCHIFRRYFKVRSVSCAAHLLVTACVNKSFASSVAILSKRQHFHK
ncbi:hypothetical protein B0O99DRAFT_76345 [Bisporella sp. PMI_857]|nr:hypothetical protein B0O99DRAFT_76345 [Bisporella sp. PMI_857]